MGTQVPFLSFTQSITINRAMKHQSHIHGCVQDDSASICICLPAAPLISISKLFAETLAHVAGWMHVPSHCVGRSAIQNRYPL